MIVQTTTGKQLTVTPGRRWHDGETYWTGTESTATLAALGYTVLPDPAPPTAEEIAAAEAARQAAKPAALKTAENAYLSLSQALGVADGPATTAQVAGVCEGLKAQGKAADALEIGLRALALIHEVEVNGGRFADIPTTPHEV